MEPFLVLFDVDGTLVDCAGAGRRSLERAFERVLGADGIEAASRRVRFEGKTDPTIIAEIAREAGVPPARLAERSAALGEAYVEILREEMARPEPRRRVLPGVRELLEALVARADAHLGLLTGNLEAGARAKLEPFGLNGYFRSGGFSSDHADRVEIARIARQKVSRLVGLEFGAARVCVVGDTELDVECARANGYRSVAVPSGWVPRERLETARPDALLDDLRDLPAALAALGVAG